MSLLHLHPTPTAQWHALVSEAESMLSISLEEDLESYLVFLLIRFMTEHNMTSQFMATEWLHILNQFGQKRQHSLQTVGDHCLIFSGLFPGIAKKRHVSIGYYVNIGKSAYYRLSHEKNSDLAALFLRLHENFVPLMEILHTTRTLNQQANNLLTLEEAEALWHETGSFHAKNTLESILTQQMSDLNTPNNTPKNF
jgi:hypothetical protein